MIRRTRLTEARLQVKKIKQLEKLGYYVIKMSKTNKNGIPDLIAIPKGAPVLFVEIKGPQGFTNKLLKYRHLELAHYGFKVEIYNGYDDEGK